jgi:hypothetical protein
VDCDERAPSRNVRARGTPANVITGRLPDAISPRSTATARCRASIVPKASGCPHWKRWRAAVVGFDAMKFPKSSDGRRALRSHGCRYAGCEVEPCDR